MTNPLRSLSNGREHRFGSVSDDSAVSAVNPAIPIGQMLPSVPPAIMTSASPYWMLRNASPIVLVPVAQAVTSLMLFPLKPNWIDTLPAAMLEIIIGTRSGLTRPGPFSRSFLYSRSIACRLPTPLPIAVPTRYGSSFSISSPASAMASFVAATAYWQNSSMRFAALGSI